MNNNKKPSGYSDSRDRYLHGRSYRNRTNRNMYMAVMITILTIMALLLFFIFLKISSIAHGKAVIDKNSKATVVSNQTAVNNVDQTTIAANVNANNSELKLPVDHSYFNDTVFIGDSVSVSLSMYVDRERNEGRECLGNAYVLANGSLGYVNAIELPAGDPESVLPMYKGEQQNLEDAVADIKPKKVYILLGMNDIYGREPQEVLEYTTKLISKIKEKTPGVSFFLESATPRLPAFQQEGLNNQNIITFNSALKQYAEENGYKYLDVYSALSDENGYLVEEYCGDPEGMGVHLSYAGDEALVNYLLNHPNGEE